MKIGCSYCREFLFNTTPEWEEFYINKNGKIKYVPTCSKCLEAEMRGMNLVRGIGPMENTTNNETTATKARRMDKAGILAAINFDQISTLIDNNQLKISKLANEMGANPTDLKTIIQEHFGERIVFKRGRGGGVVWSTN